MKYGSSGIWDRKLRQSVCSEHGMQHTIQRSTVSPLVERARVLDLEDQAQLQMVLQIGPHAWMINRHVDARGTQHLGRTHT